MTSLPEKDCVTTVLKKEWRCTLASVRGKKIGVGAHLLLDQPVTATLVFRSCLFQLEADFVEVCLARNAVPCRYRRTSICRQCVCKVRPGQRRH